MPVKTPKIGPGDSPRESRAFSMDVEDEVNEPVRKPPTTKGKTSKPKVAISDQEKKRLAEERDTKNRLHAIEKNVRALSNAGAIARVFAEEKMSKADQIGALELLASQLGFTMIPVRSTSVIIGSQPAQQNAAPLTRNEKKQNNATSRGLKQPVKAAYKSDPVFLKADKDLREFAASIASTYSASANPAPKEVLAELARLKTVRNNLRSELEEKHRAWYGARLLISLRSLNEAKLQQLVKKETRLQRKVAYRTSSGKYLSKVDLRKTHKNKKRKRGRYATQSAREDTLAKPESSFKLVRSPFKKAYRPVVTAIRNILDDLSPKTPASAIRSYMGFTRTLSKALGSRGFHDACYAVMKACHQTLFLKRAGGFPVSTGM